MPDRRTIPFAKVVVELLGEKIGVECPHCDYKVLRGKNYFSTPISLERCPRCMKHYRVRYPGTRRGK